MGVSKTITLPVDGATLVIELGEPDPDKPGMYLGGAVSGLCTDDLVGGNIALDTAFGAVESMVLAQACAGIDVESGAYLQAIQETVAKLEQMHGV